MCVSMTTIQVIFNDRITAVKILQKSGNNAKDDHGMSEIEVGQHGLV